PSFEHIILDNCSVDNTSEILGRYPHLRTIREPDKGQSDAMNKGFKIAMGDIIGWLNADDKYLPGCFEAVSEFFNANPGCDVLYGDYRCVNKYGRVIKNRREIDLDLFILKYLHILYIPTTSSFFRRRVFEDGNWLDPNYDYSMDYDFFLRLALKDYRFFHLNKFFADFRRHSGNKSLDVRKALEEQMASLLTHDVLLRSVPTAFQHSLRWLLCVLACFKRYWKKNIKGSYVIRKYENISHT
ncbi:MAG: glycosyltransferase family 2 protein, partial [Candidatus Omnitrophota bacterium]|nr:glycosyltransferase family 2 protein [Candidatus Omnitrophota bacterium]